MICNVCENYEVEIENKNKFSSAVIVGCARDIEKFLDNTLKKIEMIYNLFQKSQIIIYENDSKDNTLKKLNEWKNKSNLSIKIINERNVQGLRTHRLSNCRNILLKEALKFEYEYFIVIDLDDVIQSLDKESILSSLNYKNDWSVLCSNQNKNYYDLWALRTLDDWMPYDCWECNKIKNDIKFCVNNRYKNLKKQSELIEVVSCFGGLAIYKTKSIKNCKYYGGEGQTELCEHVKFNECIRNYNNGKVYINTNMINH